MNEARHREAERRLGGFADALVVALPRDADTMRDELLGGS